MKTLYAFVFSFPIFLFLVQCATAQNSTYSWRYYRPGNTGIQGDYNEAIWIDANGNPYIGGYNPFFEEGGFAKFMRTKNKWINYSNVDYPVIGNPQNVGSARIAEIVPDATGKLWMANWTGIIAFDPLVGASSLQRFDSSNSLHPGGRTVDIDVAPDGSVWATVISVSWGDGGLVQYEPKSTRWKYWDNGGEHLSIQPKANGGYFVWIDIGNSMIRFDSKTQKFTTLPNTGKKDEIVGLPGKDCVDNNGNLWAFRTTTPGEPNSLDFCDTNGIWHKVPFAYRYVTDDIWAFRAFDNKKALLVDGKSETWFYNGNSWVNKGIWREGGYTDDVAMDKNRNIWICGTGGAAVRNNVTGLWQRYRVTNTSQFDYFNNDLTLDTINNYVYVAANAGPGIGGMTRFDGERWLCFDQATYGLGEDWPFPNDNCEALVCRPSNQNVVVSPYEIYGIHEWDGSQFEELQNMRGSEDLCEDSYGRIWSIGEYFDLRYYDRAIWTSVSITAWGANIQRDLSRPGTVWACANGEVVRTDGNYRFSRLPSDFPELNSSSDVFTTVAAGTGNTAWIGTTAGLIKINAKTGAYKFYSPGNSAIPGEMISPYITSPDGRVWFTNFGSYQSSQTGLCWFDGQKFGIFPVKPGSLPHAQIVDMEIKSIPEGYELWMSCMSQGIAVLKVKTQLPLSPVFVKSNGQLTNTQTKKSFDIKLFPIPVKNELLNIIINNLSQASMLLYVYDADGKLYYSEQINAPKGVINKVIDLVAFPSGIYAVQLISGKEKQIKKFVKAR
jgi:streptogramin lyase